MVGVRFKLQGVYSNIATDPGCPRSAIPARTARQIMQDGIEGVLFDEDTSSLIIDR